MIQRKTWNHPQFYEKEKSVLPSLNLPPAAYPLSTIPKSASANVTQFETGFPFNEQEELMHTTTQHEGPIKLVSPPISDSEDSPTDDDNKRTEESKPKPLKESMENSFLLFEKSLKAREDWLDKENIEKDAPILEITAVSEGEDNQELLETIEELGPESETEFDNRIKTAIEAAQKLMKKTQKMGKEVNIETKENLDPGISSSDEEDQPTPNPPLRTRKSVTFGPEIPARPDILENVSSSTFKEPKVISTPYSSNKEDRLNTVTSSTRYKPRRIIM